MIGSPIFFANVRKIPEKCPVYARKMPTFYPVLCGRIVAWKFWTGELRHVPPFRELPAGGSFLCCNIATCTV